MFFLGLFDVFYFFLLKEKGVMYVVDLILGDRISEILIILELGFNYFNVLVDWEGFILVNFLNYVVFM